MDEPELSHGAKCYLDVALSFVSGLIRLWGAEAASARLMCALTQFHASGKRGLDGESAEILRNLDKIPRSSYESLAYITDVAHLVYATTLLDTFLSDTTLFLLLLHPGSIGKNQQVSLQLLLDASSRSEAIAQAAAARAREIGYLPFAGRLQYLRETFGLAINLAPGTEEFLVEYATVRNAAVHDQGLFELGLDEQGRVKSEQKACPVHPTKLPDDVVAQAIRGYREIAGTVALAVFDQVLKASDHPAVRSYMEQLRPELRQLTARSEETPNNGNTRQSLRDCR